MTPSRRRSVFLGRMPLPERNFVVDALRAETVGGLLLLVAAVVALLLANTPAAHGYEAVRDFRFGPSALHLDLSVEEWAKDGLLTLFFFVAGIELKRELVVGELRSPSAAALPVVAAVCGMVVPALVYLLVNGVGGGNARGWAVPTATDIAFALAVLAVIGSALPSALRAFLLTLAVVDDLLAIVIIAVVYTSSVDLVALGCSVAGLLVFWLLLRLRVRGWYVYVPLALVIWAFMHASGVHPTVAGVAMGLMLRCVRNEDAPDEGASIERAPGERVPGERVPIERAPGDRPTHPAQPTPQPPRPTHPGPDAGASQAERVEHLVRPVSAGLAVPVFALFAAGVPLSGAALGAVFTAPEPLGVVLGLLIGKAVGVFGGTWLAARFTRAALNPDLAWEDVLAVAFLGGIGFTVSLLIGELAFPGDPATVDEVKAAVLVGSLLAAIVAGVLLKARNARYLRVGAEDERDDDRDGVPDVYERATPEYHLRMAAILEERAAEHRRLAELARKDGYGDDGPA